VTLSAAGEVVVQVYLQRVRRVHHRKRTNWALAGQVTERGSRGPNTFVIVQLHHHRLTPATYKVTVHTVAGTQTSKTRTAKVRITT
jgi:hypothetical protein